MCNLLAYALSGVVGFAGVCRVGCSYSLGTIGCSEFIKEFYADYIADPNSLPESWRKFFEGLSEDDKSIYKDLKGPSWSPEKKIKKPVFLSNVKKNSEKITSDLDYKSIKQEYCLIMPPTTCPGPSLLINSEYFR